MEGEEEQCTSFQNRSFRGHSASTSSLRYVPSLKPNPIPTADGDYAEIDGRRAEYAEIDIDQLREQRQAGHQRHGSEYEKVLIRDKVTGRTELVDTEDSHPLSPSRSNTSTLQRPGAELPEGKLKLSDIIPPLHPQAGNDYEVMVSNPGFRSNENIHLENFGGAKPSTSGDAEVVANEGFDDAPAKTRSLSVSNNPMYSTMANSKKVSRVITNGGTAESMKNPHFAEYDVPPDNPRLKSFSSGPTLPPSGVPAPVLLGHPTPSNGGSGIVLVDGTPVSTYDVLPNNTPRHSVGEVGSTPASTYDVPPNNTPRHSVGEVASTPASTYDIPPNNTPFHIAEKASNASGTYDVPPNNTPLHVASDAGTPVSTYDVPPNDTPLYIAGKSSAQVKTYDVPPNNTPAHITARNVNGHANPVTTSEQAVYNEPPLEEVEAIQRANPQSPQEMTTNPSYFPYTIPTHGGPGNTSGETGPPTQSMVSKNEDQQSEVARNSEDPLPHAHLVPIQILSRDPPKKEERQSHDAPSKHNLEGEKAENIVLSNSSFYKYDVPQSNMPAPKLDTS